MNLGRGGCDVVQEPHRVTIRIEIYSGNWTTEDLYVDVRTRERHTGLSYMSVFESSNGWNGPNDVSGLKKNRVDRRGQ